MEILQDHGLHLRWIHFIAGITWIGILWFFNWINGAFMKSIDKDTAAKVVPQLMPRCLWWFRWGAALTWLSGVIYAWVIANGDATVDGLFEWFAATQRGNWVGLAALYGTIMAFNVWFMIWPRQKKIIKWTIAGENPPEKAKLAGQATFYSRVNTFLSLPLLFAMGAAKHAGELTGVMTTNWWASAAIITAIGFLIAWLFIFKVGPAVGKSV